MPRFSVTVLPAEVSVCAREGETILDAILRTGFSYRYACRRGGCTECKTELVSGEVTYNKPIANQILPDEERERGICLSCRAVPVADVVMRLQQGDELRCVLPFAHELAKKELSHRHEEAVEADVVVLATDREATQ